MRKVAILTRRQVLLLPLQGGLLDVNHLQEEKGDLPHLDGNHQDITDIMTEVTEGTEGEDTSLIKDKDILILGEVHHVIIVLHGSGDPLQGGCEGDQGLNLHHPPGEECLLQISIGGGLQEILNADVLQGVLNLLHQGDVPHLRQLDASERNLLTSDQGEKEMKLNVLHLLILKKNKNLKEIIKFPKK